MSVSRFFRPFVFATLVLSTGAVAACGGEPTSPSAQGVKPGVDGTGAFGEVPLPAASTSPAAAAPPPAPTPAPVPESTTPSKAGYVWGNHPSTNAYAADTAYVFNSSGGAVNITRTGVGQYTVTFAGLADSGGVAHAQAYGSNNYCNVNSWTPSGANQNVLLACRNPAGALADSRYVASFAAGRMGKSRFSYLWANEASAAAKYSPDAAYAYDAANTGGLSVQRTAAGRYDVYIPAGGPNLPQPWTVQVTGYATDARCKLASFSEATQLARVECRSPAGAPADARFSLSFASEGSALGRTDRKYGFYADDENSVTLEATGAYKVTATGNGGPGGLAMVTARGSDSTYCTIGGWNNSGADMVIDVDCFNPAGAPTNTGFELALSL